MRISTCPEWAARPTVGLARASRSPIRSSICDSPTPAVCNTRDFNRADQVVTLAQVGQDGILSQVFHLPGDAGECYDRLPFALHDKCRGCAHGIFHGYGAARYESLTPVIFRGLPVEAAETVFDLLPQLWTEFVLDACRQCHGLPRWDHPLSGQVHPS